MTFNPNKHDHNYEFHVHIKRLDEKYPVTTIKVLEHAGQMPHVWGFAKDTKGKPVEFDVTWGDLLTQEELICD